MIITGIAPPPQLLHDRSYLPSSELVYLAKRALGEYQATHLITSLSLGWEQALAKAAIELKIPYTVAIPYPGRDVDWKQDARILYLDLLARSSQVYQVADMRNDMALLEGHYWRVDRADLLLSLWEYEFQGEVYAVMNYAMQIERSVVNLWEDWFRLYHLRRRTPSFTALKKVGARVFERKSSS